MDNVNPPAAFTVINDPELVKLIIGCLVRKLGGYVELAAPDFDEVQLMYFTEVFTGHSFQFKVEARDGSGMPIASSKQLN